MKIFTLATAITLGMVIFPSRTAAQIGAWQIPINPKTIPQFVDPLPHFAGNRVDASGGSLTISYEPCQQIAVSTGTVLATGTVGLTPGAGVANFWGYSVSNGSITTPAHWPAFSVVARQGIPVNVTYVNNLHGQTYSSVNLIVDQTVHWAAPLGMDMMNMSPYDGPVPVAPHLHGGEVPSESDGGPDSWFTPGYAITGPAWLNGVDQFYNYPLTQEPATIWFHDHALGATRLNVYAGLAGYFILKGDDEENAHLPGWSGDDLVQEVAAPGKSGIFNPAPYLPEIEIAFQDRMFDNTGGLYYPNLPTNPMVHPFWTPEFVGDIITVNGKTWPYLSVAPRKYRFRLLNGSNARFYEIRLMDLVTKLPGPQIIQIGTDGGLLDAPVPVAGVLVLAPGERADVVIDFSAAAPGQVWTLTNSARTPYPKGGPPNGSTTGRIMQFVVNGQMISAADQKLPGKDLSSLPLSLRAQPLVKLTNFAGANNVTPTKTRQLTLNEVMGMGGPLEILVNNTKFSADVTENPVEGTTEAWQIINTTADAHPMHLHLVQFQLVSRQPFNVSNYMKAYNAAYPGGLNPADGITYAKGVYMPGFGPPLPYNILNADQAVGGNPAVTPYYQGVKRFVNPNERGWKDTFIAYPGEITTFIIRFAPTTMPVNALRSQLKFSFDPGAGPGYVWHCHIIDHEDNEMMRPYTVTRASSLSGLKSVSDLNAEGIKIVSQQTDWNVLEQNYPNPFRLETEIRFTLPEAGHVIITLYNSNGVKVQTILDAEAPAGLNTVRLNAGNLNPGTYFYELKSGLISQVKKMIIQ